MKPRKEGMTREEKRVIKAAVLCWKYEPVSSVLVGYSRRWENLMKACAALQRKRRRK